MRVKVQLSSRDLKPTVELRCDANHPAIGARRRVRSKSTCVVQLGCYGDILNVLPLLEKLNREEEHLPTLLCMQNFMDLGRMVDYAQFVPFPGSNVTQLQTAKGYAEAIYRRVLVTQCWKNPWDTPELAKECPDGYCEREFMHAGYHAEYKRGEFDNINLNVRDLKHEQQFFERTTGPMIYRPFILVNTIGVSSPLRADESELLFSVIREEAAEYGLMVYDMRHIRAPYFGLLLGLFDRARLLVTIDTATLHLAGAHKTIPYIALIQDRWAFAQSITRGNCLSRIGYTQFATRENLDVIRKAIRETGA